ncbi:AMP-binding protein, partial [Streptomyces sp. NPDC127574]|uniref:AMP-binding protein n=1 Tax=Streptomyces sp. NPDC127574 TaxID=3345401 RepID=UPI00363F0366
PPGTGAPDALTHRNLSHFATAPLWRQTGEHTLLWHGPHTVEALALELWMPLLNGGRVVVTPHGEPESDTLTRAGATDHISTLWLPAARLTAIAAQHPERLAPLREVITGGDRVPAAALRRIREACPHLTITTGHGSGESTVFTARHRLTPDQPLPPAGTIGHPPRDPPRPAPPSPPPPPPAPRPQRPARPAPPRPHPAQPHRRRRLDLPGPP